MKAWLGNTVYEVNDEQLAEINRIAKETYQQTGDHSKGLEAAIKFAQKSGFPVRKKVKVIDSASGELLPQDPEAMQKLFDDMFAAKMKKRPAKRK